MSILIFIAILLLLVLVHEFGHFIVAKKSGIRVDEFGFGFPPKLFGKKFGETEYTFNLLPIGGFVRIFGENPDDDSINGPDKERSFVHKPKYIQSAVLFAGVAFNWILAWIILSAILMMGVPASTASVPSYGTIEDIRFIAYVVPDSPAYDAGVRSNDEILNLQTADELFEFPHGVSNDVLMSNMRDFVMGHVDGFEINFIDSDNNPQSSSVVPKQGAIPDELDMFGIGMGVDSVGILSVPWYAAFWEGAQSTVLYTKFIFLGLVDFFSSMFLGTADFAEVSGPVGIVTIVGEQAENGLVSLLMTVAIISINLAILNLLPIPALDGGRLFFLLIEVIKGSPIKPQISNMVNAFGFILLLLLMLIVTYNDIIKLI